MAETPEIPPIPPATPPLDTPQPEPAAVPPDGDTGVEAAATPVTWMAAVAAEPATTEAAAPFEHAAPESWLPPSPEPAAPEATVVPERGAPEAAVTPSPAAAPAEAPTSGDPAAHPTPGSTATGEQSETAAIASVPSQAGSPPSSFPTAVAPTPVTSDAPVVAPEPAPVAQPIEASPEPEPPGIATSVVVPPLPAGEAGEGGEWELLRDKLRIWFDGADLQGRWESLGGPLRAAGLLLAAIVLLRLYSALLETLGDLPLVPRLLQLVGLVTVVRFALTRLVRSSERERILTNWRQRWNDFRGRD